jgi:hypothetical protein
MLEQFQTRRQILFDVTANYLEPLNSCFERLAFLCSLRDATSGKYVHEGLAAHYGVEAVDEVLGNCHEEVFERLLETRLAFQQEELRKYLSSLQGSLEENVKQCQEASCKWIPPQAPSYLTELFCSNLKALLELLQDRKSTVRPGR